MTWCLHWVTACKFKWRPLRFTDSRNFIHRETQNLGVDHMSVYDLFYYVLVKDAILRHSEKCRIPNQILICFVL